jgi:deazaflavin-dependent oxidoreductase (nitroreductase family)
MVHSTLNVRLVQLGTALHVAAYRLLRGQIPQRWLGRHCILLETHGRKSGRARVTPLLFLREGQDYIVVGSWGGSDRHPHWFLNLRADPSVIVNDHGRHVPAVATVIEDDADYGRIWQRFVSLYSDYAMYQRRTARKIPLVRLSPRLS